MVYLLLYYIFGGNRWSLLLSVISLAAKIIFARGHPGCPEGLSPAKENSPLQAADFRVCWQCHRPRNSSCTWQVSYAHLRATQ
ncbi:MAG: hypothetical protein JL50_10955 [Peptococcaceae bacterium BICA1-7]|nr:MAG: hypothetical protein JL50_10955 [Peptococcaceae bacterium BICA1-7]HBV95805.1 hypothetical protein [Desulfotomaculum sp.]